MVVKYPNGKQAETKKIVNRANLGMALETDINKTNEYYLLKDICNVHKKPTPIQIVKVDYPKRSAAKITEAYFKLASTTDYNGVWDGKYIDFEAKEIASSSTAFTFALIHPHQITHLQSVLKHQGIAFIIIRFTKLGETYLVKACDFIPKYLNQERKSLPIAWIRDNGYLIESSYTKPCDYMSVVTKIWR